MINARDLEKISLFAGLTGAEREVLSSVMTGDTFPEGHVVYRENEAGCAVHRALDGNQLDEARWTSFRKLEAEARYHERRVDATAAQEEKRRWKRIHKAQRQFYKH